MRQPNTRNEGYRLLMQHYQEQMYWTIRKMVKTHDTCDDILQEVLIKVFKNIDKYKGESKLYTWMYRITVNETLRFLNKNKLQLSSLEFVQTEANSYMSDQELSGDRIEQILNNAVDILPPKQKMVFNLRYYQEMKYAEMSKVLETSEGSLKAAYHHAIKKIEAYIHNYGLQG